MKTQILKTLNSLLFVTLAGVSVAAFGQTYPTKPVRVIVASAPGGLVDTTTRLVLQKLGEKWGQTFVIENRPGDTVVGTRVVKAAPADGYTLLATSNSITLQPFVKLDPGYDLQKDLIGVAQLIRSPWIMVVGSTQPDKTVAEFVARAKKDPTSVTFASGGFGTTPFLAAESFLQRAGLKLLHVPYKGNGAAMPDLISGRVSTMFEAPSSGGSKVKAGQLRALAVTAAQRIPSFPDLPTLAELGYPNNFTSQVWIGLFAPTGTPKDIIQKLNQGIQSTLADIDIRKRYEADGAEVPILSSDELQETIRREMSEMERMSASMGLQKQ